MRWEFLDQVLEKTDSHLSAIYTWKDEDCAGHFPGNPVVPGIKLVEMASQAGALLWDGGNPKQGKTRLFRSIENAVFKKMVRPGETVLVKASVQEGNLKPGFFYFKAEVFFQGGPKDGEAVFSGVISLAGEDFFEVSK